MKLVVFGCCVLGLIGSIGWVATQDPRWEAWVVLAMSIGGLATLYQRSQREENKATNAQGVSSNANTNNSIVNINMVDSQSPSPTSDPEHESRVDMSRQEIINAMKNRLHILFIDDDKKFQMVKIIKDSDWKKVKSVTDVKSLDEKYIQDASIIFVDIHGVGLKLHCANEGLDLAAMLKKKYPDKMIVLYSANSQHDVFHEALSIVDYKLKKNATPYEFQNLIENTSVKIYKSRISI